MKPFKISIIVLILVIPINSHALWEVRNNTPTTAQISMDFKFENKIIGGVLLVNFMKEMSCNAEVSFAMFKDSSAILGDPISQKWANSRMIIWVDDKTAWNDRTAVTQYTNAFETGGMANTKLVSNLMHGNEAIVQPLSDMPKFVFSLKNSSAAIEKARENCFVKIKD